MAKVDPILMLLRWDVPGCVVGQDSPMSVDRQHESREAQSLYPSALQIACDLLLRFVECATVTPSFKAKTRCSSYVCPGSSCHTYGQNISTENQYLYYVVSYYKTLLQLQKGLNSGMDTILPQAVDRGCRTPRRSLHQSTPLLSSRA
jgi:hypothetical protein